MSTQKKGQINVRLDIAKYNKLKALSKADNRSMSSYTTIIVEEFLKGKYFPRKRKQRPNYGNQSKQIDGKSI